MKKKQNKRKYDKKKVDEKITYKNSSNPGVNRTYKNTIFQMLFHRKKELLSLYNALNDSHYTNENDLIIVTLENAVYMSMKNDLAFVMDMHLHMYEHQSTYNPNMPLRDLFYVSQEYQKMVDNSSLYSSKMVKIPSPRFIVFYNGTAKRPERQIMKLSDLYELPEENPMLELQVLVLNINQGNNNDLKEKCKTLQEYMLYVERIRYYVDKEQKSLQDAVEIAVDECIKEGILTKFLRENKAEAIAVSIFEYDAEKEIRLFRKAERELAREEARAELRGEIREEVKAEVKEEVKAEVKEEVKAEARREVISILVNSLKKHIPSLDEVYTEITSYETYKDISKEEIEDIYNQEV